MLHYIIESLYHRKASYCAFLSAQMPSRDTAGTQRVARGVGAAPAPLLHSVCISPSSRNVRHSHTSSQGDCTSVHTSCTSCTYSPTGWCNQGCLILSQSDLEHKWHFLCSCRDLNKWDITAAQRGFSRYLYHKVNMISSCHSVPVLIPGQHSKALHRVLHPAVLWVQRSRVPRVFFNLHCACWAVRGKAAIDTKSFRCWCPRGSQAGQQLQSLTPRVVVASSWRSPFCVTMRDSRAALHCLFPLTFSGFLRLSLSPSLQKGWWDNRGLSIAPYPLLGDLSPTFSKAALSLIQDWFSLCLPYSPLAWDALLRTAALTAAFSLQFYLIRPVQQ